MSGRLDGADIEDNGNVNISDGISLLRHRFLGGPPPSPPGYNDCGIDPTDDPLPECNYGSEVCGS